MDLSVLDGILKKATSTSFPSLILTNATLSDEEPLPVIALLLAVGSQGFVVAMPGDAGTLEVIDQHLQIMREVDETLLGEHAGELPAISGRSNAGFPKVILFGVPESLADLFHQAPSRRTAWPNNLPRFMNENLDVVKPKMLDLTSLKEEFIDALRTDDDYATG